MCHNNQNNQKHHDSCIMKRISLTQTLIKEFCFVIFIPTHKYTLSIQIRENDTKIRCL